MSEENLTNEKTVQGIYMPKEMLSRLKNIAKEEGRSLCGQIVFVLNNYLKEASK